MEKVSRPDKIARHNLKKIFSNSQIVSGIFATYAGYLTVSDLNGQIRFPLKHSVPKLYLVISERITPIVRSGNTISHWEFNTDYSSIMYSITKTTDPQTSLEYFTIKDAPLPSNNVVPLESIVIIAKPKFFYVPLGITPVYKSPHLILPDVYVKKGITLTSEALYLLNVMQYFGLLTLLTKKEPRRYTTHLIY